MHITTLKKLALASTAALAFGLGASSASATPVFTINPNAMPGMSGFISNNPGKFVESDVLGSSDGTITISGANQQTETGWAQMAIFTNNGAQSDYGATGLATSPQIFGGNTFPSYGLYLTYTAVVNGIGGFNPSDSGTINPGDFNFVWHIDPGNDDVFAGGNANTGAAPTVTDTDGDDLVLAVGSSIGVGNAGFQAGTGAPIFSALSDIILCNGTANMGTEGTHTNVSAPGCGSFDASLYFTAPVPFYDFQFTSATSGSNQNIHVGTMGATLDGIGVDINFGGSVPEPISISLFGAGLAGAAAFGARRRNKKA